MFTTSKWCINTLYIINTMYSNEAELIFYTTITWKPLWTADYYQYLYFTAWHFQQDLIIMKTTFVSLMVINIHFFIYVNYIQRTTSIWNA